jgi:hypothetical protein
MSIFFSGKTMLIVDLFGSVVSISILMLTSILTPAGQIPPAFMLWGCTALLGVSLASIFATVYSIPTQQYGWEVDSHLATMLTGWNIPCGICTETFFFLSWGLYR